VICAVLVAVAIGAGAAIALGHHEPAAAAGTQSDPATVTSTRFATVNALNHPSSAVPAGWVPKTQEPSADKTKAGFTMSLPPGWTEQSKGLGTYFQGPSDMLIEIDLTPHKYPNDMVREAGSIEQGALSSGIFPHYQRTALAEVPVRGTKGALWQFTWSLNGVTARTDDILFVMPTRDGSQHQGPAHLRSDPAHLPDDPAVGLTPPSPNVRSARSPQPVFPGGVLQGGADGGLKLADLAGEDGVPSRSVKSSA
jgi:hypothetical protein